IDELPDGSHKVVTDLQKSKVVGVFGSAVVPTTLAELLNRLPANLPAILALISGGLPAGFGVAVVMDFFQDSLADFVAPDRDWLESRADKHTDASHARRGYRASRCAMKH